MILKTSSLILVGLILHYKLDPYTKMITQKIIQEEAKVKDVVRLE